MSWQVVFDGSEVSIGVEEMEPLSSKLLQQNERRRDVDEYHWETGQRKQ